MSRQNEEKRKNNESCLLDYAIYADINDYVVYSDGAGTLLSVQMEYFDNLNAVMESRVLLQGALLSGGLEKPEI